MKCRWCWILHGSTGIIMSSHFMNGLWIEKCYQTAIADTFKLDFFLCEQCCSTFSECFVGWSGGNKDTGTAVDKVTSADCEASG
jgi:hypothetical protein